MTVSLASLEDFAQYEEIRAGITEFDNRMINALLAASALIEKLTRRSFDRAAKTEYLTTRKNGKASIDLYGGSSDGVSSGFDSYRLYLNGYPLDTGETTTLNYDPGRDWNAAGDLVEADKEYYVDPNGGYVLLQIETAYARDALKIDYTAGYPVTVDTPKNYSYMTGVAGDLKMACLIQAQSIYRSIGHALQVGDDNTANRGYIASSDVQGLIGQYVRPLVARR